MNKQAVTTIIALSVAGVCAQSAQSEPQSNAKRSLSMAPMPPVAAPHAVARPAALKPISRAALRKKARAAYPSTHFDKGQYFKSKGDANAALIEFLKASQENPRLVRAFYEQALIFRQKHYLKLAESSLEQALAVKPDYQDARILLATIRIDQGDVGAAMKELSRSLGIGISDTSNKQGTAGSASQTGTAASAKSSTAPSAIPGKASSGATTGSSNPLSVEQLLGRAPAVLQSLHSTLAEIPLPFFNGNSAAARYDAAKKTLINPAISGNQPGVSDSAPTKPAFSLRPYPPLPPKPAPSADANPALASRTVHLSSAKPLQPDQLLKAATTTNVTAPKHGASEPMQSKPQAAKSESATDKQTASPAQANEAPAAENKNDDDVFVLRIPKSFKFFWQHKSQADDSSQEKQQPEKEPKETKALKEKKAPAVKTKHTDSSADGEKSEHSKKQPEKPKKPDQSTIADGQNAAEKHEGRSWLFHFFHGTADDTATTDSTMDQSTDIAADKPRASHKGNGTEELKQFVLPPAAPDNATADGAAPAAEGERAPAAKSLTFASAQRHDDNAVANNKLAFVMPTLPSASSALLSPLSKMAQTASRPKDEDEWTNRLRYLSEHGTASLKEGEAFMFAEDSGEATLFLPDGRTIRRQIAQSRNQEEIVRERRPDILIPDELMYNLSLLGKLMPKFGEPTDQSQPAQHADADSTAAESAQPNFNVDNLMGDSQSFWGWLKHIFQL